MVVSGFADSSASPSSTGGANCGVGVGADEASDDECRVGGVYEILEVEGIDVDVDGWEGVESIWEEKDRLSGRRIAGVERALRGQVHLHTREDCLRRLSAIVVTKGQEALGSTP